MLCGNLQFLRISISASHTYTQRLEFLQPDARAICFSRFLSDHRTPPKPSWEPEPCKKPAPQRAGYEESCQRRRCLLENLVSIQPAVCTPQPKTAPRTEQPLRSLAANSPFHLTSMPPNQLLRDEISQRENGLRRIPSDWTGLGGKCSSKL